MTRVFVAGSRSVSRLNDEVKERLDNIIKQNLTVLVGDANGADKAVQAYLAGSFYRNVVVYAMESCRNNIGGWELIRHIAPSCKRDRRYYGIKDLEMAKNASCGFMLWDGKSKGTLTNVINLLNADKSALLYLSPKKQFFKLRSFQDLSRALQAIGISDVSGFIMSLEIKSSRENLSAHT